MFTYSFSYKLRRKLSKLAKKDKVLALILQKKKDEVISHNLESIDTYKNLKSPQNEFKRIHLTGNQILLFKVEKKEKHIVFVDILHHDKVYK